MFGIRTPVNKAKAAEESSVVEEACQAQAGPSVRRSVGEWEAEKVKSGKPHKTQTPPKKAPVPTPPKKTLVPTPPKVKPKALSTQQAKPDTHKQPERALESSPREVPPVRYANRTTEAKACLCKAKMHLDSSRNLKKEIKDGLTKAVERLYHLVKEGESERAKGSGEAVEPENAPKDLTPALTAPTELVKQLMENLQQHKNALEECQLHTRALSEQIQRAPRFVAGQGPSFAEMAAVPKQHIQEPLHSVIVSSVDDRDTGEEVIAKLRTAVDARNEGTRVERLRKARDQKVVVGFRTREELTRVTERIRKGGNLVVEEVKNKDPLIIVKDVLSCHSDVEVTEALVRQNTHLLGDVPADDLRMGVKYRRKTRNPHMCHVILQVSPSVWQRLTHAGRVHIDLQRVRVLDQSPLIQCTRCLRFGHGRKLCTEPADLCTHCGDPHMRVDCPSRLAAEPPKCHNCVSAKLGNTEHNAFDSECPVRVKWDGLARLSVAYC